MPSTDLVLVTRRQILRRAAWALTAAACPRYAWAAGTIGPTMLRLSDYMSSACERALPPAGIEAAKLHVLDTFAAMLSGSDLRPGRAAIAFARAYGGAPTATVAGSTVLCGPVEAALANGVLAHAAWDDGAQRRHRSAPGAGRLERGR